MGGREIRHGLVIWGSGNSWPDRHFDTASARVTARKRAGQNNRRWWAYPDDLAGLRNRLPPGVAALSRLVEDRGATGKFGHDSGHQLPIAAYRDFPRWL